MKCFKIYFGVLLCMLMMMPAMVLADNKLTFEPFTIKAGETQQLVIDMENDKNFTLVQFDLQLPEGLSVTYNEEDEEYNFSKTSRATNSHTVTSNKNGNVYTVILASQSNKDIKNNSGAVIYVEIAAASTFKTGTITLKNIELASSDETAVNPAAVSLDITLPKVTVTINNAERKYGEENPPFTYTSSTTDDLTGLVTLSCEATKTSNVRKYAITGTSSATDLDVTFVYGELTVNPAALTVTADAKEKVFGAADPELTYVVTGLVNGDQLTGTLTRAEGQAVGTYAIEQGTLATSSNYTLTFNGANLTIKPKTVTTPTIVLAETSFTFDGTAKEPAVTVKDGETTIPAEEYTVAYDDNTNVGTATVTITDNAGGNYTVSGTTTFTITPKTVTAPTIELTETSFTFDGTAKEPVVTAVKAGETTIPAEEYTVSYSNNTNAGPATVTITDNDGGNYTVSGTTTFTITPKTVTAPTIELTETSFTFDGTAKEPAVTAVKDGQTTIPAGEYTVSYSNNTTAGTATVTVTDNDGGNYTVSGTTTFTITPKAVTAPTIELAESSFTYDGTAKKPAVTAVKDGETTIPAEEYTISYSNNTNAGTATVTIADKDGGNYAVSGTKTFTIAPKTITSPVVTLAKTSFTYSGTVQEPAVTVKDGETAIPTSEYTVTYSGNKNVGTATATVTDKDGGNYTFEGSSASFTITKAMLTVTARNASRKVDQENPTFELTYSGFKNGETESVLTVKPVATTEATADSPVGDYVITVSGGEDENYDFTYVNGTLTIAEKTVITITAKNATRKYGNANPTFEYTVSGGDITGTPELTCQATATSPVGEYTIKVVKGSITTDANFVFNDGALTVTKALLKVTAKDASREEGEENPTFELTYSGFKNGETESVLTVKPVATTPATTTTPAGMYPINVEGGEAQNYEFSYVSGTLTITEKEVIDGISTLSLEKVLGTVYTLSGQRVEKPRKGRLYIVNGRKVVLK